MASLPVIANVYRVAFNWADAATGQTAVNVMHFNKSASNANAVVAAIDAAPNGDMFESIPNTAAALTCDVTPLDGSTGTTSHTLVNYHGSGASGEISPATAVEIKLTTGLRGRSYRGRVFLPLTREGAIANGFVVSGVLSAGNGADGWQDWVDDLAAASCNLVVASYKLAVDNAVVTAVMQSAVRTQRRRQARLF